MNQTNSLKSIKQKSVIRAKHNFTTKIFFAPAVGSFKINFPVHCLFARMIEGLFKLLSARVLKRNSNINFEK